MTTQNNRHCIAAWLVLLCITHLAACSDESKHAEKGVYQSGNYRDLF